jgi:hypothetical protein
VHRVVGLVGLQCDVPDELARPLGVAAFFHDAAIWTDRTWDYLGPSARRAIDEIGVGDPNAALVEALIAEHHRLRPVRHGHPAVEAFRRADLIDVTGGLVCPGGSRARYRDLITQYPAAGFRPMLLRAFGRGLREAPLRPLPMVKF